MPATKRAAERRKTNDAQHAKDRLADVAAAAFHDLYRSWSIDTLLVHPRDALKVCRETAARLGQQCTEDFEHRVCRALLNARKHGDLKRDPV